MKSFVQLAHIRGDASDQNSLCVASQRVFQQPSQLRVSVRDEHSAPFAGQFVDHISQRQQRLVDVASFSHPDPSRLRQEHSLTTRQINEAQLRLNNPFRRHFPKQNLNNRMRPTTKLIRVRLRHFPHRVPPLHQRHQLIKILHLHFTQAINIHFSHRILQNHQIVPPTQQILNSFIINFDVAHEQAGVFILEQGVDRIVDDSFLFGVGVAQISEDCVRLARARHPVEHNRRVEASLHILQVLLHGALVHLVVSPLRAEDVVKCVQLFLTFFPYIFRLTRKLSFGRFFWMC